MSLLSTRTMLSMRKRTCIHCKRTEKEACLVTGNSFMLMFCTLKPCVRHMTTRAHNIRQQMCPSARDAYTHAPPLNTMHQKSAVGQLQFPIVCIGKVRRFGRMHASATAVYEYSLYSSVSSLYLRFGVSYHTQVTLEGDIGHEHGNDTFRIQGRGELGARVSCHCAPAVPKTSKIRSFNEMSMSTYDCVMDIYI